MHVTCVAVYDCARVAVYDCACVAVYDCACDMCSSL